MCQALRKTEWTDPGQRDPLGGVILLNPLLVKQLRQALHVRSSILRFRSPLEASLCVALAEGPSPALLGIFERYYRVLASTVPDLTGLLAGIHYLALGGTAASARFFPTCGGQFDPAQDGPDLAAALEQDLAENADDLLDFLLSQEPAREETRPAALFLLAALTVQERFGGALFLLEIGAGGGTRLLLDRIRYRFGNLVLAPPAAPILELESDWAGPAPHHLLRQGLPALSGRLGVADSPRDLTDPEQLRSALAFLPPDRPDQAERLRSAAAAMEREGRPEVRLGDPSRALVEAYNAMAPGTTLMIAEYDSWHRLTEGERIRKAQAIQSLAAQIQPHKPIAWVQAEPAGPDRLELTLHTFGWADREDRAVRRLAEADADLRQIRWLEGIPQA